MAARITLTVLRSWNDWQSELKAHSAADHYRDGVKTMGRPRLSTTLHGKNRIAAPIPWTAAIQNGCGILLALGL